jgi:hypothetical protein
MSGVEMDLGPDPDETDVEVDIEGYAEEAQYEEEGERGPLGKSRHGPRRKKVKVGVGDVALAFRSANQPPRLTLSPPTSSATPSPRKRMKVDRKGKGKERAEDRDGMDVDGWTSGDSSHSSRTSSQFLKFYANVVY